MTTATLNKPSIAEQVGFDYASQPQEPVHTCPVCDHRGCLLIDSRDRYGLDIYPALCNQCGFVYLRRRMTRLGYAEFYERWYRPLVSAFSGHQISPEVVDAQGIQYAKGIADAAAGYLEQPYRRTVLDIGGSTGSFAQQLISRWGYKATVLDPAPDELALSCDRGFEVISGMAEDLDTKRTWDVVSMIQTVDHLMEPTRVFQNVRKWLSPHGVFVVDFVDYTVFANAHGIRASLKVDHPLYFTNDTARCLLSRTGFEVLFAGCSEDRRHLLYVCRPVPAVATLPSANSLSKAKQGVGL